MNNIITIEPSLYFSDITHKEEKITALVGFAYGQGYAKKMKDQLNENTVVIFNEIRYVGSSFLYGFFSELPIETVGGIRLEFPDRSYELSAKVEFVRKQYLEGGAVNE